MASVFATEDARKLPVPAHRIPGPQASPPEPKPSTESKELLWAAKTLRQVGLDPTSKSLNIGTTDAVDSAISKALHVLGFRPTPHGVWHNPYWPAWGKGKSEIAELRRQAKTCVFTETPWPPPGPRETADFYLGRTKAAMSVADAESFAQQKLRMAEEILNRAGLDPKAEIITISGAVVADPGFREALQMLGFGFSNGNERTWYRGTWAERVLRKYKLDPETTTFQLSVVDPVLQIALEVLGFRPIQGFWTRQMAPREAYDDDIVARYEVVKERYFRGLQSGSLPSPEHQMHSKTEE